MPGNVARDRRTSDLRQRLRARFRRPATPAALRAAFLQLIERLHGGRRLRPDPQDNRMR
jgi:hypothetical protein